VADEGFEIDLGEIAALVGEASDEQLAAGLAANREAILGEVFRRMPEALRAERARGLRAVVEWRIRDAPGGGHDAWRLEVEDGACRVTREATRDPDVAYEIGAVDFLRLVTGNANGPRLFVFGRLRVEGDLVLAARMPGLFSIPAARRGRDAG
jgi:putative sterol carrier protein